MAKYDTKYTLKSVGHAFTRPLHWKGKDFAKLGIILGGTAVLSLADEPIRDFVQNQRSDFPGVVRDFGGILVVHKTILWPMRDFMVLDYLQKMRKYEKPVFLLFHHP